MTSYTEFIWGYKREAIWGTSIITANGDTAYKLGLMMDDQIHPLPYTTLIYDPPLVNVAESASAEKTNFYFDGQYTFLAQNGIFLEWIMGKSTTAGASPYVHTIVTPTDGSELPSFTTHLQLDGDATALQVQSVGVKVTSVKLYTHAKDMAALLVKMNIVAKETLKSNVVFDTTPALPTTATTGTYTFGKLSREFDSVAIDGLISVDLTISAGISVHHETTYDGASYDGHIPAMFIEQPRRSYLLTLEYIVGADTLLDELLARGNTKNLVLKWEKSANDYIQITCTTVHVLKHPVITRAGDKYVALVECEVVSLSIEVKDTIAGDAGGAYGE